MTVSRNFRGGATTATLGTGTAAARHQCVCYHTQDEKVQAMIPFVKQGLAAGEQCLYVAEDPRHSPVLETIRVLCPVGSALAVVSAEETYLPDGRFDPERTLTWVRQRGQAAKAAGFSSLRLVAEVPAIREPHAGAHHLAEYESKLNALALPDGISLLCTYDASRFPGRAILDAVQTHPSIVVEGTLCENPHFVPPDQHLRPGWSDSEVRWLLRSLRRLQQRRSKDRDREHRRQRLWLRLLEQQEAERRAFARDLHDDLGQVLTAVHLRLQADPTGSVARALPDVHALLSEAMNFARRLSFDLRPPVLDDLGLAAAVRSQVRRQAQVGGFQARVDVATIEGVSFPSSVENACFRVMVAALDNVVRHASAAEVQVEVQVQHHGQYLNLTVRDDGEGFDVEAARARARSGATLGLLSMEERTLLAGGSLVLDSAIGTGTVVQARLPVPVPAPPSLIHEGAP